MKNKMEFKKVGRGLEVDDFKQVNKDYYYNSFKDKEVICSIINDNFPYVCTISLKHTGKIIAFNADGKKHKKGYFDNEECLYFILRN